MQFRTIRTALDHEGEVTLIRDLTLHSRGSDSAAPAIILYVSIGRMTATVISNMTFWKRKNAG